MNHRPVCVKCQVEMRCRESGVGCLDMANFGPYKIWDSDFYECPKCGYQILTGFGKEAMSEHYMDNFDHTVNAFRNKRKLAISHS